MTITWFLVLVAQSIFTGWESIPVVSWLLLVPFAVRDYLANKHNDKVNFLAEGLAKAIQVLRGQVTIDDGTLESAVDRAIASASPLKSDKPGQQAEMMGLQLTKSQHDELQARADKRGLTFNEMMIELVAERVKARGGELGDARIVGHFGSNGEEIEDE